ncbi:MAG TPA: GGDEF domain-containing protein [Smithella sp.]|nr:GGDEF domain-containing protein [Smithella sp.]HNY49742.1 GGDEF domain-containing protein [Smithella sp.]HOG90824.1 GGDEF domain-containing protein [Smithella sp.]HOU51615.1 GGDEF domain-containing protein [Smithella sp.]HQG65534.1 GGDEF domain-containing protein [Smithella sp.]
MTHKSISLNINGITRKLFRLGNNISLLAQDFSIIPKNDPKQALRLGRFFISLGIYILNLSLTYLAYYVGVMELKALYGNWILILTANIILYIVFRTGWNKRMKDPSLTSVQICIASLVVMYSIFFIYQAKGILLSVYILILLFGIFRLNTRQFLHVSAFILITYGIDIFLLKHFHPQEINIQAEFFQWMAMSIILISVSFIGGNISALRRELSSSRKQLQASLAKIQEMAIQDDLTGFYNRRHLMELIENEHSRAARTGATFSVAMMDLDKFKNVNDTLGHQAGDAVLMTFANIIRNVLRKTDFCGRYGGEEFLIVLTQTRLTEAKVFAERIRACVEECLIFDAGGGQKTHVTVSIGLAEHLKNEGIYRTIARADEAVYKAKKNGRNRVEVSE